MNECKLSITLSGDEATNYMEYRKQIKEQGFDCITDIIKRSDIAFAKEKTFNDRVKEKVDTLTYEHSYIEECVKLILNNTVSLRKLTKYCDSYKYNYLDLPTSIINIEYLLEISNKLAELDNYNINNFEQLWYKAHPEFVDINFNNEINRRAAIEIDKCKELHKLDRQLDKRRLVNRLRSQSKLCNFFKSIFN